MKLFTLIMLVVLMASCAKVTVKKDGENWDVTYSTLWRKVENVGAAVGDVEFHLGSAGSDSPISDEVIACMIAPSLCK